MILFCYSCGQCNGTHHKLCPVRKRHTRSAKGVQMMFCYVCCLWHKLCPVSKQHAPSAK